MIQIDPRDLLGVARTIWLLADSQVFERLCSGPASSADLAAACGLDARALDYALAVSNQIGITESRERRVALTGEWQRIVRLWPRGCAGQVELWKDLDSFLHGVQGPLADRDSAETHYAAATPGMKVLFESAATLLAQRLELDSASVVLDVGGGSGIWGRTIADRIEHDAKHILLDLPRVLAENRGAEFAVAADAQCLPLRTSSCDVVVAANVLHARAEPARLNALREMLRVVHNRGQVVLVDSFRGLLPFGLAEAVYDLNLAVRGATHPDIEDLQGELDGLGARVKSVLPLGRLLSAVVVGRRS